MMGVWWRGVVVMVAMVVIVAGQEDGGEGGEGGEDGEERCNSRKTCGECIQIPDCIWCTQPNTSQVYVDGDVSKRVHHCRHNSTDISTFCDPHLLQNPSNEWLVTQDRPFSEITRRTKQRSDKIVQMRPQNMSLKLRRDVPQSINLKYRLATDYPVDLYYLMDLSASMKDDKDNLAGLVGDLAELLNNLTSQYRIGFGSFVDKVLVPFVDTSPGKLDNPCRRDECVRAYSFRNELPLHPDHNLFTQKVVEAKISGNMDAPEGGFDALMQAMVCQEQIGWRETARKILVFSTDEKFHYAGDGRLAGITTPNDMQCHLTNDSNEYQEADKYDYPSIAQINQVATERSINIIWAISSKAFKSLYTELSKAVKGSSYGEMDKDSANVITLVKEQYEKLSSVVELSDNSSDGVEIVYRSRCLGSGDLEETMKCDGVRPGHEIEFNLEVKATKCPADGEKLYVEVKTHQDSLVLEIEVLCSCDCDNENQNVPNAINCSLSGSLVCGVCQCDPGFSGEKCQCSNVYDDKESDEKPCRAPSSSNSSQVCSGLGYCSCGICICDNHDDSQHIHGKYCECNRLKCITSGTEECHGRGSCACNKCHCSQGYIGDLCECEDEQACVRSGSTKVCSGRGTCECGKCKCHTVDGIAYSGRYCEDCPDCSTGRCLQFRDCVQCRQFQEGPMAHYCDRCNITPSQIDSLNGQIESGSKLCKFDSDDGCQFSFTYRYDPDATVTGMEPYLVHVRREKECPPPQPVQAIAFGLIGAFVAIGVITLVIWKIVTTIHDRKEFDRFERERQGANWSQQGENPLYKGAQTTFQNPAFAKKGSM